MHSEAKTFGGWSGVKTGSKEATALSKKNIKDRLKFCRKYKDWTAEDWCKVIFSDEAPFTLFGTSGKLIVWKKKGECYYESCVVPTVKHPETIYVWGCFSSKGMSSLLPTIQEQFVDDPCIFQHDGAHCHKPKVIMKWLGDHYIEMLDPWPENSPDLNPIKNLWSVIKKRVDKQKPRNCDKLQALIRQEWIAISQDLAQKLISSMPE